MQELVGSSLECTNLITTATLSRLLGAQVYKKMKGQSDEILIIGGESCQQSVAKFSTKTIQWSNMPVCLLIMTLFQKRIVIMRS
ncbi:unnamed protein product [Clavelina lepadiformis]|uniref:Uncharacterized protein n=1 Tax=Clavelina lepadiformis TaxID=159417 RepID=A0ABP0GDM7_CLALP